jgi:hypothetical protein
MKIEWSAQTHDAGDRRFSDRPAEVEARPTVRLCA